MKFVALAVLAAGLVMWMSSPSPAAKGKEGVELNVGDKAPEFEAVDDQGKTFKSSDVVGKKILVVYFYPADCTGGCTMQARAYRDDQAKLADKGVVVVGVSGDSVKNHQVFKKVHKLNFALLADEEGTLTKKFGVPHGKGGEVKALDHEKKPITDDDGNQVVLKRGVTAQRWTFVIGKDGKILYKNAKVNPSQDSKAILKVLDEQGK